MSVKKTIVVIAPFLSLSGYGQHSRLIIDSLLNHTDEYEISLLCTRWGSTPQLKTDKYKTRTIQNISTQPDISIQIGIPNEFQRIGKYSIGISAVTESSVCSLEFIEGANRVDLIIVPSEFTKKVLQETEIEKKDRQTNKTIEVIKCKTPINVLFEGVDTNVFDKNKPLSPGIQTQISNIKEDFAFLVCGTWLQGIMGEDRKNISGAIHVFLDLFKRKGQANRPALIVKTNQAGFSEIEKNDILTKIRLISDSVRTNSNFKSQLPNVYLLHGKLEDDELNTLYNHPKVKALISFTHAEGFGLPLLEFSTTGKPILAPNYSGHLDFLSKDHGAILLPGKMTKIHDSAANEWLIKGSEWFTVNYQFAGQIMNDVYENYDKYLVKSRKHTKYTKDNFSVNVMETKLMEMINSIPVNKPQMIIKLPKLEKIK